MIMQRLVNVDSLAVSGDWNSIWKLNVPAPRVKMFLWRACRGCLPTRVNLRSRGVDCSIR